MQICIGANKVESNRNVGTLPAHRALPVPDQGGIRAGANLGLRKRGHGKHEAGEKEKKMAQGACYSLRRNDAIIYGGTGIGVSSICALKMESSREFDLSMDVIVFGKK